MNCIIVDDDEASANVLKHFASQVNSLNVLKSCTNPIEAFDIVEKEDVQLMFLDVEMPEMSGLDLLRTMSKRPHVILTTSSTKYAIEAYDLNVIDYLVKPIELPRFVKSVAKVQEYKDSDTDFTVEKEYFFIKKNSVLTKVLIKDILWIEALGDYIQLHTREQRFIIHSTLKSLENKLPSNKFVRIHRRFIIQLNSVRAVEGTTVYIDEMSIPVGAVYGDNFMKRLNLLH